jgi:hypothetical protein
MKIAGVTQKNNFWAAKQLLQNPFQKMESE